MSFSAILEKAIAKGFTEPDPREDLCGNDVARKLLILAKELDLKNKFDDIQIKNLIPKNLRDHVLRYISDLYDDIVIQGAGAEITARGVFGDLLRIAEKK
ncbi:MAG: hypothetical protein J7K39_07700 [Bacteroidales bacterium]|nr:hypothetical protein [Bacteroidales bacterium]